MVMPKQKFASHIITIAVEKIFTIRNIPTLLMDNRGNPDFSLRKTLLSFVSNIQGLTGKPGAEK